MAEGTFGSAEIRRLGFIGECIMKTILVDSEPEVMQRFACDAKGLSTISIVGRFETGQDALQYTQNQQVDLAVLNMNLPDWNGAELGKCMRNINSNIMLVYIVNPEDNVIETLPLRAAAYLLKPYTAEDVVYALQTARLLWSHKPKRIYARTFGYFDLFLDNRPVIFKSSKAKELLALLIDRQGGVVDSEQMIAILWDGRPKSEATQSLCSKLCKTLYMELQSYGIEELLHFTRSSHSINLDMLSCDLYDMLDGSEEAKRLYYGEYMTDYEWAEYRNYSLSKFI